MKESSKKKLADISTKTVKRGATKAAKLKSSPKNDNPMMTDQAIMPPARVWDKIEKALDEQDKRKSQGTEIINTTLRAGNLKQKKQFFTAIVAGIGSAAFFWLAL